MTRSPVPTAAVRSDDVVAIAQVLARYAVAMTKDDVPGVLGVFTPDGTYSAFGGTHTVADLPAYLAGAPKGLLLPGPPAIEVDGDEATGKQVMCFIDQASHEQRLGYWTDTYRRTEGGWLIASRSMTFLRRSGAQDGGKHVPSPVTPADR